MSFFALTSAPSWAGAAESANGQVPAQVAQQLGAAGLPQSAVSVEGLVWLNKAIYTLKTVDKTTGLPAAWAWDEKGQLLADRGAALRKQEAVARRQCDGAMTDSLWVAIAPLPADQTYLVMLWLPSPALAADKETLLAQPKWATWIRDQREAGYAAARAELLQGAPWLAGRLKPVTDAPAVVADLTRSEAIALAHVKGIVELLPFAPGKPSSSTSYVDAIQAAYGTTLRNGMGEKVCMIEADKPSSSYTSPPNTTYCQSGVGSTHARCSAAMIRSQVAPNGSAELADIPFANWNGCSGLTAEDGVNWCTGSGAYVWNIGFELTTGYDALLDHYAKTYPFPLITVPTGQQQMYTDCPTACSNTPSASVADGLSVLILGGSRDCETASRADDMADCGARSANPTSGREVPHVVAPSYMLMADGTSCGTGTSWSSALTAGGATQILETNSALRGWPEALRAILMATATVSVDGVTLSLRDAVDDRDGAGEVDISKANRTGGSLAKRNGGDTPSAYGHDYGTLTSSSTPAGTFYSEVYNLDLSTVQPTRVVLTWDGSGACTDVYDVTTCSSDTLDADLDLFLYDPNGNNVAYSSSSNNSFEFIQFQPSTSGTYTVKIQPYSWTASSTYFGLAWFSGNFTTN